jgi:hypothetical protein
VNEKDMVLSFAVVLGPDESLFAILTCLFTKLFKSIAQAHLFFLKILGCQNQHLVSRYINFIILGLT